MSDADADNSEPADPDLATRVLVLAPTSRDAEVTLSLLAAAGLIVTVCGDTRRLAAEAAAGGGAALVTEEAVGADGIDDLLAVLGRQPPWSDFPIVLLMRGGSQSAAAGRVLQALRNVTVLERPAPMRSVVSAVQAAIRSRRRQYVMRDQLDQIQRAEREREGLLASERAARSEAERANRLKDDFLATVSHELRTPLNAILGWSQLLRHATSAADREEGINVIERNARTQAQLIGDLLDMSRILSGKLRLDAGTVDLAAVVDAAVATVRPTAEAKGVDLRTAATGAGANGTEANNVPRSVLGDPARLEQVLWNLLANAVKFTPAGGRVMVSLGPAGPGAVAVSVVDNGAGIDPDFLPHLFERFRQADSSTTRKHGGLGLGLAIVKQLVELHGGRIEAASPGAGCGATFTVTFPLPAAPRAGHAGAPADAEMGAAGVACPDPDADLTGLKVLVVDDDADARGLVGRLLAECRADVTTASSAAEAMELLPVVRPDVLVSDIGMPDVDGYELIRQVRAAQPNGRQMPAVALTAFARPEDRRRALAAGYQRHVAKPVEPAELVAVVASVAGRTGAGVAVDADRQS